MRILFLGPDRSPLVTWLRAFGEEVVTASQPMDADFIRECLPEFVVIFGYRFILTKEVLTACENAVINIHVSYLPWNRGADPNLWSFVEDTPKGVTIHFVDEGIDTGDIIAQRRVPASAVDTLRSSYDRLQAEAYSLFTEHWPEIRAGESHRQPQNNGGTFHRLKDKEGLAHILAKGWDTPIATLERYGRSSGLARNRSHDQPGPEPRVQTSALFRVDASLVMGSGHVMRCLTLAEALRANGAESLFICCQHAGHLSELIRKRGFAVTELPLRDRTLADASGPAHEAWLSGSWQDDAEGTRAAIESWGRRPDWLVVDHYGLDQRWESALRSAVGRILAIDDLADRRHDCNLLLDQNLVPDFMTRYVDKVPPEAGLMLGPSYALLQPAYAELRQSVVIRQGMVRRILVSFGGADTDDLTGRTLAAFLSLGRPNVEVDVVMSSQSPHLDAVRREIAGHAGIRFHCDLPTLAPLMAAADLGIGGGGATSWERLCLGLPSLVVTLASNQRPIASELSDRGLIRWLGDKDAVDEPTFARALAAVLNVPLDESWSRRCLTEVDGRGTARVSEALKSRMSPDASSPGVIVYERKF